MTAEDFQLHDITRQDGRFSVLDRFLQGTVAEFNADDYRTIPPDSRDRLVAAGLRRVREAKQGVVRDLAYDLLEGTHGGDYLRERFHAYLEHFVGAEIDRIIMQNTSGVMDPSDVDLPEVDGWQEDLEKVEKQVASSARAAVRRFALERLALDLPDFRDPSDDEDVNPYLVDQYNRIIEIVQKHMPVDEAFDPMSLAEHVRQLLEGPENDHLPDSYEVHGEGDTGFYTTEVAGFFELPDPWLDDLPLETPEIGDSDPEYSQDNPQSDQEDDVSDGDVDAHVAFEVNERAKLERILRRVLVNQLAGEKVYFQPGPDGDAGPFYTGPEKAYIEVEGETAEALAERIAERALGDPNLGPDLAWGLLGRLYADSGLDAQLYAHLQKMHEDVDRMLDDAHGQEAAEMVREMASMAVRRFIVEHDLTRGDDSSGEMCAASYPDEPHVVCELKAGHDGEHHSGSYTWPQEEDVGYPGPCDASHPEHGDEIRCRKPAGHDGPHFVGWGHHQYEWSQEEDEEEGDLCGQRHPAVDTTCHRGSDHDGEHRGTLGRKVYEWGEDEVKPHGAEQTADVFSGYADRRLIVEEVERILRQRGPLREIRHIPSVAEAIVDGLVEDTPLVDILRERAPQDVLVAERTDRESPRHGIPEVPLCEDDRHNDDPPEAVCVTHHGKLLCDGCYDSHRSFMDQDEFRFLEPPSQTSTEVEEGEPIRRFEIIPREGSRLWEKFGPEFELNAAAMFTEDGMLHFLGPKGEVWTAINRKMVEAVDVLEEE